ncbi:MAG: hypothetical protein K6F97_07655 [Lachnospiraceae bacterium]|nr:hypothetical protein [Lachnospiraceae bacterium]
MKKTRKILLTMALVLGLSAASGAPSVKAYNDDYDYDEYDDDDDYNSNSNDKYDDDDDWDDEDYDDDDDDLYYNDWNEEIGNGIEVEDVDADGKSAYQNFEYSLDKDVLNLSTDDEMVITVQLPYYKDRYEKLSKKSTFYDGDYAMMAVLYCPGGEDNRSYPLYDANNFDELDYDEIAEDEWLYGDDELEKEISEYEILSNMTKIELKKVAKKKTIKIKSSDILKTINSIHSENVNTNSGVIKIIFEGNGGDYSKKFEEKISFPVITEAKVVSAKALNKSVLREYGNKVGFSIESTLGGTAVAEIYNGSKKIATVKEECKLGRLGNGEGKVYWNLKNSSGKYVGAGTYKAKLYTYVDMLVNNNGKKESKVVKTNVKTVSFTVKKSTKAYKLSTSIEGTESGTVSTYESPLVKVTVDVSVGSQVTLKFKNPKGKVLGTSSFIQTAGTAGYWTSMEALDSGFTTGKYTVVVTTKTLEGKKKSSTHKFTIKKAPKSSISETSLSFNNGVGNLSFRTSQPGNVTVQIKDSKGNVKSTVIDKKYSAGKIDTSFSTGGYAAGNYKAVITVKNSGGTATQTKNFKVTVKPTPVKKPTVSGLTITSTQKNGEDAYKISCKYTGKGAKLVMDVMWDDTEEIVYSTTATASYASGNWNVTWDGYKANGFKAAAGNYTIRIYAVNSAGATEYLRKHFVIGEG